MLESPSRPIGRFDKQDKTPAKGIQRDADIGGGYAEQFGDKCNAVIDFDRLWQLPAMHEYKGDPLNGLVHDEERDQEPFSRDNRIAERFKERERELLSIEWLLSKGGYPVVIAQVSRLLKRSFRNERSFVLKSSLNNSH